MNNEKEIDKRMSKKARKKMKKRPMSLQIIEALKDLDVIVIDYNTDFKDRLNKKQTITMKLAFKYEKD